MADADPSLPTGTSRRPAGFSLAPMPASMDCCWYTGAHDASGRRLIVRTIAGVPFADALRDIAGTVALLEHTPAGIAAPLAVLVTINGIVVAGAVSPASGFLAEIDRTAAATLAADAVVDVWVAYDEVGDETLGGADRNPGLVAARLLDVAAVLDTLPEGHGTLDSPALRTTNSGPLVLAVGLASLESARRDRCHGAAPWLTVAPERCLPPGSATRAGDEYALAVLWTIARTGVPPHRADTADGVVRAKLSEPARLEGLAGAERDAIARALDGNADRRFGSCTAFVEHLCDVVGTSTDQVTPAEAAAAPVGGDSGSTPEAVQRGELGSSSQAVAGPTADRTGPVESAETVCENTVPGRIPADRPTADTSDVITTGDTRRKVLEETSGLPGAPAPVQGTATSSSGPSVPGRIPAVVVSTAVPLASAPYKAGDVILPGYRLEKLLGKGGFGEVWRAVGPGGRRVAIKVIGNLGRKEGKREFAALRTVKDCNHPHIVPIFGVWLKTADGRLLDDAEYEAQGKRILSRQAPDAWDTLAPAAGPALDSLELIIAMGLGDCTLHDQLREAATEGRPGIDPPRLLTWMRQAALAIDWFNQGLMHGGATGDAVQHCDIKPQNMLLVGNGVQVCDFGLARVHGQSRVTANNLLSVAYAAPEMMIPPHNPSRSTDQYSLGVSYYELRTGRLPYGDQTKSPSEDISVVALMRAKTVGDLNLSLVPPGEQRVLRRALSLDPTDRFDSCEEFIERLAVATEDEVDEPLPPPPIPWWRTAGVGGGLATVVLLTWFVLRKPEQPPPPPPPPSCAEAKEALLDAVGGSGVVSTERLREASLLADANRDDSPACAAIADAAEAALRTTAAIESLAADPRSAEAGEVATRAVVGLPPILSAPLREALRRQLGDALVEGARMALDAAVRDDGSLDDEDHLESVALAERAAEFDDQASGQLLELCAAVREVADVIAAPELDPSRLDGAVNRLRPMKDVLPQGIYARLARRLAVLLVDRADRRIRDHELLSDDAPASGKLRVIEDSIKDVLLAVEFDPGSWTAHNLFGFCESLRGNYAGAVGEYGNAIRLLNEAEPDGQAVIDVLRRRAYALVKSGQYALAADDYAAFLPPDGNLVKKLWALSGDAWEAGKPGEVADVLARLDELLGERADLFRESPSAADVLGEYAWILACGFGEDPERRAVGVAQRALAAVEALPDDQPQRIERIAGALDTLGCAQARAGRFDEALRTVDQAIDGAGNPNLQDEYRRHRARFLMNRTWDIWNDAATKPQQPADQP